MEEKNLKEMMGVGGGGGIAAIGVNQDGSAYNAGGNPANKFGEPPGIPSLPKVNLLKRKTLLPNGKGGKPLRNILDPSIPIGRV